MRRYIYIMLCLLACTTERGIAQNSKIALKAMTIGDSIVVRWVPINYSIWQLANKNGYKVERLLVGRNGVVVSDNKITMLHSGTIKPLEERQWEQIVKIDSVYAPIALQALYGKTFELTSTFNKNLNEAYNKYKENELRFGFAMYCADRSLLVAKTLGLCFVDKHIQKGERYIYKVTINEQVDEAYSSYTNIDPSRPNLLPRPPKANVNMLKNSILLNWDCFDSDYVGYDVERSIDGKSFKKITKDIVVPFQSDGKLIGYYSDSIAKPDTYYYRVVGLTPFGVYGPSSDTIKVVLKSAVESPFNLVLSVNSEKVIVTWSINETKNISHYIVKRSNTPNGEFSIVGQVKGSAPTIWEDQKPLTSGYYKVIAVSKSGSEGESLSSFIQLNDSTPPHEPIGLEGKCSNLGIATIQWKPNEEIDLLGYKVYKSNSKNGTLVEATHNLLPKNIFIDSLDINNLNDTIYYKVVAVDRRYNASSFSSYIAIAKPDRIKPVSPVLLSAQNSSRSVVLKWENSSSVDVANVLILKRISSDTIVVGKVQSNVSTFIDTTVNSLGSTFYLLRAVDKSGNISNFSNEVRVSNTNASNSNKLKLSCNVQTRAEKIIVVLSWDSTENSIVRVYRSEGSSFKLLKRGQFNQTFVDEEVRQGVEYSYFIVSESDNAKSNIVKMSLR